MPFYLKKCNTCKTCSVPVINKHDYQSNVDGALLIWNGLPASFRKSKIYPVLKDQSHFPFFHEDFLGSSSPFYSICFGTSIVILTKLRLNNKFHTSLAYNHYVCYRLPRPNRFIEFLWACVLLSIFPIRGIDLKL